MQEYNDEKLPEDFEQIAKAYSRSLKNKGFVFVKLEEEEFTLLIDEIAVIFEKIFASLKTLSKVCDCQIIGRQTELQFGKFCEKFGYKKRHSFRCIENVDNCFLALVSLENLLNLKLMLLSMKSGELEFCHEIIVTRSRIYADSFPSSGFVVEK